MDVDDDEYIWTTDPFSKADPFYKGLQEFERCLHCQICGSFFYSPVSIQGCFHTFCSECIRGTIRTGKLSLRRTALCPICRAPIEGNENDSLCRNRSMEEAVRNFRNIRSQLVSVLSSIAHQQLGPVGSQASDEKTTLPCSAIDQPSRCRNTRNEQSKPGNFIGKEEKEKSDPEPPQCEPPRRRIPATYYNGMKRRKLQEKCREWGLSEQGSDQQLKARHQEFVNLYNAECDSFFPRSEAELVRIIHEREKAIREEEQKAMLTGAADHSLHIKGIKDARKAAGEGASVLVGSGNSTFDKKLSQGFKDLCANLKKRKVEEAKSADCRQENIASKSPNGNREHRLKKSMLDDGCTESESVDSTIEEPRTIPISDATIHSDSEVEIMDIPTRICSSNKLHCDRFRISSSDSDPEFPTIPPQKGFKSSNETCFDHLVGSNHGSHVSMSSRSLGNPTETISSPSGQFTQSSIYLSKASSSVDATMTKVRTRNQHYRSSAPSSVGPWNCARCTFFNKIRIGSRSKCEMCESPRTAS